MGLLDMRAAKAEYIRALKDLRAADAEYVRAKAAVEQANARYRDAETAYQNAKTQNQNLLNDLQELWNEAQAQENERRAAEIAAEIEGIQMQMEELAAKHAIQMVQYEAQLAQAQEGLRVVLRDIAIASKSLSPNEKLAVIEAAALVAVLTDAQYEAVKDLAAAEAKLDSTLLGAIKANFVWDEGLVEGAEDHYKHQIEEAQANIAQYKALREAIPDTLATLEEWKAVLDNYDKAIEVIEEQMAKNTYDSSAFFKVIVGSGIQSFNEAIAAFIEENWEQKEGEAEKNYWYEPTLTQNQKDTLKAGAPKKDDYYYSEGGPADSLTFKPLTTVKGIVNFNKFTYMLTNVQEEDYTYNQENKFWKSNKDHKPFMGVARAQQATDPDTLFIYGKINKDMQDFILGKAGNGIGSQTFGTGDNKVTASYGLWGAYDIMERVYKEAKEKYNKHNIDSLVDTTAKIWTIQHDILAAGLAAYKPYTEAIADFEDALDAYDDAKEADAELAADLVEARDYLGTVLKAVQERTVNDHKEYDSDFNYNDTVKVLDALIKFAEARDAYIAQTAAGKKVHDSTKFYQYTGWVDVEGEAGKATVDSSKAFTALTYATLTKGFYDKVWNAVTKDYVYGGEGKYNNGLANIAAQLISVNFGGFLQGSLDLRGTTRSKVDISGESLYQIADTTGFCTAINAALFGTYKFDGDAIVDAEGDEYQGAGLAKAAEDLEEAEADVVKAVIAFVKVYDEYWGQNVVNGTENFAMVIAGYYADYFVAAAAGKKTAAETAVAGLFTNTKLMKDGKLAANSYTIEDFKPYGNETPLVTFGLENLATGDVTVVPADATIDTTNAFLAVLTAVDPACEAKQNNHFFGGEDEDVPNIYKSYVMYGGNTASPKQTTLFKALYWQYVKYIASSEIVPEDLKAIKTWIEDDVQKVFVDNAGKQPVKKFNTTKWEKDSTNYVNAVARNVVVNAYLAKKKEFVGTRTEVIGGKDSVVMNDLYVKYIVKDGVAEVGKPLVDSDFTINHASNNITALFATNILGDYVGWAKELGGQQLANAKKAFGEKPYEQIQEWKDEWKAANGLKKGLAEAKVKAEAVYVAKAKVEGIDGDKTSIAEMIAAREAYKTDLTQKIADEQTKINNAMVSLEAFLKEDINWEMLIAQQTADVAAAEAKLEDITKMLEKAQSNLDKIMEYIRSTDAEFVIPVTIEEIDALIASVKKNLPTTASSIASLIAAYMGVGVEDAEDGE